jgi:polyisoprenoid-binding protein YceI
MRFALRSKLLILLSISIPYGAAAERRTFIADPAQSNVVFTLGDVLHTVHGTFKLKSGALTFDDQTGVAGGELVVDATSGDSGSTARDNKMKKEILETQKYPEIVFTPKQVKGAVAEDGKSQVELEGIMMLHGQPHPMTLAVPVDINGDTASADVRFTVPYVQWGLKNPSTFILRVSDKVDIVVHATGHISTNSASR